MSRYRSGAARRPAEPQRPVQKGRGRQKLGSIHARERQKLTIQTPTLDGQAREIAGIMLQGDMVLLNLQRCPGETARRILDFLAGVAYASGYGIERVAQSTYLITPPCVAVSRQDAWDRPSRTETGEGRRSRRWT